MAHNGADVHQNLPKNYLKLSNNYGIGFRVRIRVGLGIGLGLVFRVINIQRHKGADVHRNLPKTTEKSVIIMV